MVLVQGVTRIGFHDWKNDFLLRDIYNCVEEVKVLLQFSLKWFNSTRRINDQMESIESKISHPSNVYDLVSDADGETRTTIENLHGKLFQLQEQKEKIIVQYS